MGETVLKLPSGQLYLEPAYVFGAIRDGARHTRLGRGSLQPKLTSTLQVRDDKILIDRWVPKGLQHLIMAEDQPVYLDVRSVRNPATRGRNIRYRVAASPGWKTTFTIYWENTIVHENQMKSVVKDAGAFQGLGDGRTIGFGRFEITSFELMERERAKKPAAKRSVARPKA